MTRPSLRARLLPSPLLSALLFLAWPSLNASWSAGHLVIAVLLGWGLPLITAGFRPDRPRAQPRAWRTAARLAVHVAQDIVMSNIEVARRVLGPEAAIRPRFVWVPIALRDPHAIVTLAGIITLTPGTLSSELSEDRRFLLVHALHCPDDEAEAAMVEAIRTRYEAPLKEIFE